MANGQRSLRLLVELQDRVTRPLKNVQALMTKLQTQQKAYNTAAGAASGGRIAGGFLKIASSIAKTARESAEAGRKMKSFEKSMSLAVATGNLLSSTVQGVASKLLNMGIGTAQSILVNPLQAAVGAEMQNVTAVGGLLSALRESVNKNIRLDQAEGLFTDIRGELAKVAAQLPGETDDFLAMYNQLSDNLAQAIGATTKGFDQFAPIYKKAAVAFSRDAFLMAQASGVGVMDANRVLTKLMSGASIKSVSDEMLVGRNPLLKSMLEKTEKEMGKTFQQMNIQERVEAIQKAFNKAITPEMLRGMTNSVEGMIAGLKSNLFDPTSGVFGATRLVTTTDAWGKKIKTSYFQSFKKILIPIFDIAQMLMKSLGGTGDPMLMIVNFLEHRILPFLLKLRKELQDLEMNMRRPLEFSEYLNTIINRVKPFLEGMIREAFKVIADIVGPMITNFIRANPQIVTTALAIIFGPAIFQAIIAAALPPLLTMVGGWVTAVAAPALIGAIGAFFAALTAPVIAIPAIIVVSVGALIALIYYNWNDVKKQLQAMWDGFIGGLKAFDALVVKGLDWITNKWTDFWERFNSGISDMGSGVMTALGGLKNAFTGLIDRAKNFLSSLNPFRGGGSGGAGSGAGLPATLKAGGNLTQFRGTSAGQQAGAPRSYGGHQGRDYNLGRGHFISLANGVNGKILGSGRMGSYGLSVDVEVPSAGVAFRAAHLNQIIKGAGALAGGEIFGEAGGSGANGPNDYAEHLHLMSLNGEGGAYNDPAQWDSLFSVHNAFAGRLGDAIQKEMRNAPVGSKLTVANSSETILTRTQAQALLGGGGRQVTFAKGAIVIQGSANPEETANAVIAAIEARLTKAELTKL